MKFQISQDGANLKVSLNGDLNFGANQEFRDMLRQVCSHEGQKVVLELSGLNRIDSVGLGLLYIAREELAARRSSLALAHPGDAVLRLLTLTDAGETFEIRR
ncbi:MAG: STAS domain-containing protein [Actinomycetota bacterium]